MAEKRVSYDEIEESVGKLKNLAQKLEETNTKLKNTLELKEKWEGDAADKYKSEVTEFLGNYIEEAPKTIASAALFLMTVSGVYQDVEKNNKNELLRELLNIYVGEDGNKDLKSLKSAIDKMPVSDTEIDLNSRVSEKFKNLDTNTDTNTNTNTNTNTTSNVNDNVGGTTSRGNSYSSGGVSYSGGGVMYAASAATPAVSSLKKGEKVTELDKLKQDNKKVSTYSTKSYDKNSPEYLIEEAWKKQGSVFKNEIATINVEGEDRYLVKVSTTYGQVGDAIDIKLNDDTTLKCVVAETATATPDNIYGTDTTDGKVNVLEFKTNNSAKNIDYKWDADAKVTKISNKGTILNSISKSLKIDESVTSSNNYSSIVETESANKLEG